MSQKPSRLAWLISRAFQIAKDSGQAHTPNPLPSGLNWRVTVDPAGLRRMAVWRTKSTQPSGKEVEVMARDAGFEKYGLSEHTSNQGITRTIIDEYPSTLEIDPEDELDYLAGNLEAAIPTVTIDDVVAMTLEPFKMPAAILERRQIATGKLMALTGHQSEQQRAMRLAYLKGLDVDELEAELKSYGPARALGLKKLPAWDELGGGQRVTPRERAGQWARREIARRASKTGGCTCLLGVQILTITLTAYGRPYVTYENGRHELLDSCTAILLIQHGLDLPGDAA
jgi:hypothetical protein